MSSPEDLDPKREPFRVLGLPPEASGDDVRRRYLELVRQFPPEQAPQRFQQIRQAYLAATDPLVIARQLLERLEQEPRPWSEILDEQQARPPRLNPQTLLSLGNRGAGDSE